MIKILRGLLIHFPVAKNYHAEIQLLSKVSSFKEQIHFFEVGCGVGYSKSWDHNPSFRFEFYLLNFLVFGFNIYNIHHVADWIEETL